ncbi:MAG: GGDEF domain-containing protein [Pseudobutyrivibrio sp.]|nr:GGDEF domain-containing protein [Pseudobutyrivibrio sp.]
MTLSWKEGKTLTEKFSIVVIVLLIAIGLICFFHTSTLLPEDSDTETIEPFQVAEYVDGTKEYYFDLSDYGYEYSGLVVYTAHQYVEAYNVRRLIYSFDTPGGIWGKTPGSGYNFIEINEGMTMIAIQVKPAYENMAEQNLTFYIGSTYDLYSKLLVKAMPKYWGSFLVVVVSILMFIYYEIMSKKTPIGKELLYLSLASFAAGVWFMTESDITGLTVRNKILVSVLPFLSLLMLVPPLILFFESYLNLKYKIIDRILLWATNIEIIVLVILHFTGILELKEALPAIQITLVVAVAYLFGSVVYKLFIKRETDHRLKLCGYGLGMIMFAILVDVGNYYTRIGDSDAIGRFIVLVFIVMLAWEMIRDANEIIDKGRKAKQMEIFALTDSMTGLLNRNAFERHASHEADLHNYVAVVADTNGLKKCNDTYGHEAGDEYITAVADIFSDVYGKYGNCYRTGGDEFCCIIVDGDRVDLERLQETFISKLESANQDSHRQFNISAAIGYAKYDSDRD